MKSLIRRFARYVFTSRTRMTLKFEWVRLKARLFGPRRQQKPSTPFMHLGSGFEKLDGWVNVDIAGADVNIDLTARALPFSTNSFDAIVSRHLIEHLDLEDETIPVFKEMHRVLRPGGELWLSTPDMEKLCREYLKDGGKVLYDYVMARDPLSFPAGLPHQFVLNTQFFQRGQHKNLFDFELLKWTLEQCGFQGIQRVSESDLLSRFPGFPPRNDEIEVLSIRAVK